MSGESTILKAKGYKGFQEDYCGFDSIKPINIIIGRNNTGKSSLLDVVEYVCSIGFDTFDKSFKAELLLADILTESELKPIFPVENRYSTTLGRQMWHSYGVLFENKILKWKLSAPRVEAINIDDIKAFCIKNGKNWSKQIKNELYKILQNFLISKRIPYIMKSKKTKRILADRDIINEASSRNDLELSSSGSGATFIIERFLNSTDRDRSLVRVKLLQALNNIFSPDAYFKDIICRQHEDGERLWEIFLEEENKGLVSLSNSGSGIKTVLLVLINLLLIPVIEKRNTSTYMYCFEELENNLHPSLLRRLFRYITEFAEENNCHFFITTHSNVVIDQFSTNPNAQLVHVTHDGKSAKTKTIKTFTESKAILDDLGAKASDLMQANGIIWLEGPSDRIYFNKWLEIYAPDLQEHIDYECAFYGGALLTHFEATDTEGLGDAINLLKVNKNSILIGDSDKTYASAPLKPRLKNIKDQLEALGGFVWVMKAKEVENYIPSSILETIYSKTGLKEIELYQQFFYDPATKKTKKAKEKPKGYWQLNKFDGTYDKVKLAHKVIPYLTKENLSNRFDLPEKMNEIIDLIRAWNKDR